MWFFKAIDDMFKATLWGLVSWTCFVYLYDNVHVQEELLAKILQYIFGP